MTSMTSKRGLDPCLPCCSTCGPHLHIGARGSDCNMDFLSEKIITGGSDTLIGNHFYKNMWTAYSTTVDLELIAQIYS